MAFYLHGFACRIITEHHSIIVSYHCIHYNYCYCSGLAIMVVESQHAVAVAIKVVQEKLSA